ncbi:MAG: GAF domain-containing protein [Deltaproteobacteria bacterium]|nr:GAF domain-containing protein [Deltaproteobacteria bacterium]
MTMMHAMMRNPEVFSNVLGLAVSKLSMDEMLTKVVEELRDLAGCDRCSLYILDKGKNELYTMVAQKLKLAEIKIPVDKKSLVGYCVATGKGIMVKDVSKEAQLKKIDPELSFNPRFDELCNYHTKNVLCVPIIFGNEIIGAFQSLNKPGGFMAMDLQTMTEFASILALAIHNILVSKKLEKYLAKG